METVSPQITSVSMVGGAALTETVFALASSMEDSVSLVFRQHKELPLRLKESGKREYS